ncbi:MAG TPA: hypothetical protein VFH61_08150, partial [Thermoleophilia bacterium]|nr:hypothetical protein [Thermoleophilia bacterium]
MSDYEPTPDGVTPDCIALWDCEVCLNQSMIRLTIRLQPQEDRYVCSNCASWWAPGLFKDMMREVDALANVTLTDDCPECGGAITHWECSHCEIMTTTCLCDPAASAESEPCPECGRLMP